MALHRRFVVLFSGTAALVLAACGGKGSTSPTPPTTRTIAKFAGDSQVGAAGAALGAALTVVVKDQSNAPVSGAAVTWAAATGGGGVAAGSSLTDADGRATMTRTLGPAAGFQATTATLGGATGSPVTFTSIAQIQGAFSMAAGTGGGQSDTVLATLATPFQAVVHDHTGAPAAGVAVTFAVTSGGGLLSRTVDTTDGSGLATSTLTLPASAGVKTVQASVTGLIGSPVSFSVTATAGQASQIVKSSGDSQTGVIATPLAAAHAVVVRDAHGNPVAGVHVRWAVGAGGGSVSDTSPASNALGVASVLRTLGDSVGVETDTASAALAGSPIGFTATADSAPLVAGVTVGPGIAYSPNSVTVEHGGQVTWTWAPTNTLNHSVFWLTGPVMPANSAIMSSGSYQVTFATPGTYTYQCAVHGSAMTGTVIVK